MTPSVTVVGSGASGVHFALTVLRKGGTVRMLDVGRTGRAPIAPDADLTGLKDQLEDPTSYFLGERFGAVLLPGRNEEYYGIPPSKDFVFDQPDGFGFASAGFAPVFSFARGGLGEVWTGGCYPLTPDETSDFPFPYPDLSRAYDEVARRIGISGEADDLARFMPVHEHLQAPLELDAHSKRLLASYVKRRARLNRAGAYIGRTRVATLTSPLGSRQACDYTGRCLWGCPRESLYTPSQTLRECQTYPGFEYVPGADVRHLRLDARNHVRAVVARMLETGEQQEFPAGRVALAAGALLSTRIFLTTMAEERATRIRLHGLMDNRQVLVPFVNLGMLGRPFSPKTYQYHLLGLGLDTGSPKDYVHGQITTLKTALTHPLIQRVPLDFGAATVAFRAVHAALGLINVNFRDVRREGSFVELSADDPSRLRIHYEPEAGEGSRITAALRRVRAALRALGCVVPPGMTHLRPMGASVHYAGTLPMTDRGGPLTTDQHGQSRDIAGLYFVDGATFPFLPAKNITFTLMANATRIAEVAF